MRAPHDRWGGKDRSATVRDNSGVLRGDALPFCLEV